MKPVQRGAIALLSLAALSAATWAGYYRGSQISPPARFVTASTAARVPTLPGFALTWSGTGTLDVPVQVAPGAYLIGPSDDALGCVWQRLRRDNDSADSIIATGQLGRGSAARLVTVEKTDRFVRFLGGCAFRRVA
jgi:hypothetical protein